MLNSTLWSYQEWGEELDIQDLGVSGLSNDDSGDPPVR
jgi:hypothetical protein